MIHQCMGSRGARGRTGVFDGLTLIIKKNIKVNRPKEEDTMPNFFRERTKRGVKKFQILNEVKMNKKELHEV